MYRPRFQWIALRTARSGECEACGSSFGAGSKISWFSGTKRQRCGYCADGKDGQMERLSSNCRISILENMDRIRRLRNLQNPSLEQQTEMILSIRDLKKLNFIPTVGKFLESINSQPEVSA
jgi:hypothetical protein